jgi:hypothetical protein
MSFDERRYIEAIPPQLFDEMISDYEASLPANSHHKPTARTIKQIALQLADRQKYSPVHRQDCVNTTLEQLADYCVVKPASISDALRCLEYLGIVKTIRKGGGINKNATVRNVNLSVFTQWGIPPFDPNKRKKQKSEHNGEFDKHNGENSEHIGETSDQHGKHPQTLNVLLIDDVKSICTTDENKLEQTFDTDPYTALANAPRKANKEAIENEISPEQEWAMQEARALSKRIRYKD